MTDSPPSKDSCECLIKDHTFIVMNRSGVESLIRNTGGGRAKIKDCESSGNTRVLREMGLNVFVVDPWRIYLFFKPAV